MDNQQQEVVNPEVSKDVKTKSTEATENVLSPTIDKLSQDNKEKSEYQELRRDMLLSELSDEDKQAFGSLPLIQLELLVSKFSKENIKNVPDVPGAIADGEMPKDWVAMPSDQRRKNWDRILQTYMRK